MVYKKRKDSKNLDVMIYFWDERDGPELCGWWFAPSIGGDQVWAYHPSRTAATPPASEWNVPHDGPIDPTFSVAACKSSGKKNSDAKKKNDDGKASQKESKSPSK